jgi:TetR/AcrR family transcriptional regulator
VAAVSRPRLTAAERRADLLRVAGRVFAEGSYRGATTAEIAREAGVTEPILYRHFASKEDLYLACVEEAWATVKATWERVVEQERDPSKWMPAMGNAFLRPAEDKVLLGSLWVQALTEASDSERIRDFMRAHLREVHDFLQGMFERCQAAGVVPAERDAAAEAWIFVSLGLLNAIGRRLGGVLSKGDFDRIRSARRAWMTVGP